MLSLLHTLFEGLWLGLDQGVPSDIIQDIANLGYFLSHFFVVEVVHIALLISYLLRDALKEGTGNYRVIVALILDFRGHRALCLGLGLDLADFEVVVGVGVIDHLNHQLEEVLTEDCHLPRREECQETKSERDHCLGHQQVKF